MKSYNYLILLLFTLPLIAVGQKMSLSTNPADAEIYIGGKKVGTGSIEIKVRKNECITVQIVREGFLQYSNEYCRKKGMPRIPKKEYIQLSVDQSYEASSKSDIANVDVVLKPKRGSIDENWLNSIRTITDYFDALEVSDSDVKYLRTAWIVDTFDGFVVRTRVMGKLNKRHNRMTQIREPPIFDSS